MAKDLLPISRYLNPFPFRVVIQIQTLSGYRRTSRLYTKIHQTGWSKIFSSNLSTIYPSDHRKSSGTISGTWSSISPEGSYVAPPHGYEEAVEQRTESFSSKHVFGMVKTEDGQFPYLAESVYRHFYCCQRLTKDDVKSTYFHCAFWKTYLCSIMAIGTSFGDQS